MKNSHPRASKTSISFGVYAKNDVFNIPTQMAKSRPKSRPTSDQHAPKIHLRGPLLAASPSTFSYGRPPWRARTISLRTPDASKSVLAPISHAFCRHLGRLQAQVGFQNVLGPKKSSKNNPPRASKTRFSLGVFVKIDLGDFNTNGHTQAQKPPQERPKWSQTPSPAAPGGLLKSIHVFLWGSPRAPQVNIVSPRRPPTAIRERFYSLARQLFRTRYLRRRPLEPPGAFGLNSGTILASF